MVNTEYLWTIKEDEVDFAEYGRDWEIGERVILWLEEDLSWVLFGVEGPRLVPFLWGGWDGNFCSSSSRGGSWDLD